MNQHCGQCRRERHVSDLWDCDRCKRKLCHGCMERDEPSKCKHCISLIGSRWYRMTHKLHEFEGK